jgi:hypothetical protein
MKILLVTDAWEPQINGVVVTVRNLCKALREEGHELLILHPKMFWGFTLPRTAGIKVVWPHLVNKISNFTYDYLYVGRPILKHWPVAGTFSPVLL